jgi:NAD-dependent deacetylase
MADIDELAGQVAEMILKSGRTVVFSGAGISTESGIPDFRSPGGVWERFDPDDFTYDKFLGDAASRRKQWCLLRQMGRSAEPNAAHHAIAGMHRLGRLDCVITQNVDNLHQKAGLPDEMVLELHGNARWVVCLGCRRRYPFAEIVSESKSDDQVPACPDCGGILKPDIVFFGEPLPQTALQQAIIRSQQCELFIVIGSTLVVYPAAYMPVHALNAGAKLAIINLGDTPLDDEAEVLIRAKAGDTMSLVMQKLTEKIN